MPSPNQKRRYHSSGIKPFDFNPALAAFTPSMAKRTCPAGPYLTAPIVQGKWDESGIPDALSLSRGTQIAGVWYQNIDPYQGSIVLWITPEWNGNDGKEHYIFINGAAATLEKTTAGNLLFRMGAGVCAVSVASWVAGTTYCVVGRWDFKNTLDGTNYACISVNDSHTFATTTTTTPDATALSYIGSLYGTSLGADSIIQGLTIYRRPLYDGTYGTDVGNGDEINLIYAAGAGKAPNQVTGSWDVCFSLPSNGTAGALVTGTGEAWSHPHSSSVLTDSFVQSGFYGGGRYAVKFGASTVINCGSDAGLDNLADAEFVAEGWILPSSSTGSQYIFWKGFTSSVGWAFYLSSSGTIYGKVKCATIDASSSYSPSPALNDTKWHHLTMYFNDAGDRKIYIAIDGKWVSSYSVQVAGVGAIVDDSAQNLYLGTVGYSPLGIGWCRISNNDRYTHGTNFVPARTPPAVDGNTLAQWNMEEGTGVTVDNEEGTAARDGTITAGAWEEQWIDEGTPKILKSVEFNGTTTSINCGSGASIDDLHDGAFTAEGWFRLDTPGQSNNGYFFEKAASSATGWRMYHDGSSVSVIVYCATINAGASYAFKPDKKQHHWAFTFDDAGDRKVRLYKDRVLVATSAVAGVGAVVTDAANSLYIGNRSVGGATFDGGIGWVRLSNVVRDIVAETYTRDNPPDPADANTMLQLNMDEGVGNPQDSSGEGNHGILTNGVWNYTPDMAVDCPGARIYNWGNVFGNDATHEGINQQVTVVAGTDYRLRALGYSEDGIGRPELVVYDVTNVATIVTVLGTTASTEQKPDVLETCFEIPAGCTSILIKLLNAAATGVVGWHKAMLLTNLWDDPGFETGTAPDVTGTPSTSVQSNEQAHSGTYSWKVITDGVNEGIQRTLNITSGKFYIVSAWVYIVTSGTVGMKTNSIYDDTKTYTVSTSVAGSWIKLQGIIKGLASTMYISLQATAAGVTFYVDDVMVRLLDDVSLTCTPASLANSTEGTGIRVDGNDLMTQPIPVGKLKATKGRIRFKWTPRHSAADFLKFSSGYVTLLSILYDASNYLYVRTNAANALRLVMSAGGVADSVTWNCTGVFVAGTTYNMEIVYKSSSIVLKVNGIIRITISQPIVFSSGFLTQTAKFHNDATGGQFDSVISPP